MPVRSAAPRSAALALSACLCLAALAGCADDAGTTDSGAGSPATSSPSPSPEPTAPADPAAAEAQIGQNWKGFFESGDPALLEDGEQLTDAIAGLAALAPPPQTKSATVTAVQFTDADTANVTYDLTVDGNPALPGATGVAVEVDGVWKVSKETFCTLTMLASNGTPAPGC